MYCEELNSLAELERYEALWNKLFENSRETTFFQSYVWVSNWWLHFGKGKQLRCLLVRTKAEGNVLSIVPLMSKKSKFFGFPVEIFSFIGGDMIDEGALILNIHNLPLQGVMDWIFHRYPKSVIKLNNVSLNNSVYRSFLNADHRLANVVIDQNFVRKLDLKSDWENQFRGLTSNLRYDIRRGLNYVSLNHLTVNTICNGEELKNCVQQIIQIESKSHRKIKKTLFYDCPEKKEWMNDVLTTLLKRKQDCVVLAMIKKDDDPVAYSLTWLTKDSAYFYQTAFDEQHRMMNPGHILIANTIEKCISLGIRTFFFGQGDQLYKKKWTKAEHNLYTCTIYNKTFQGYLLFYINKWIRSVRHALLIYYQNVDSKRFDKAILIKLWKRVYQGKG